MADLSPEREAIWRRVHPTLLQYAIPDSRFDYDFSSFAPDFRGSSSATDRILELPCYQIAKTILIAPDNCLEQLRHRALRDGKKVLVATHKLRRGFVLLDPRRISEEKHEMASWLDGMERPGVGQHVSLTQMEEKVDMCVTGVLAVGRQGVMIKKSPQYFDIQWGILLDRNIVEHATPIVAVAHGCQVVEDEHEILERTSLDGERHIAPDFIVTPEKTLDVGRLTKFDSGIQLDTIDEGLLATIPVLQELKGIQMMEQIMKGGGFTQVDPKPTSSEPNADEQLGISIVEKLMRGYKV